MVYEKTTLTEIAENTPVYLDNSIFNEDLNFEERKKSPRFKNGLLDFGFSERIGAAKKFSDIKYSALHRQEMFSKNLFNVIKNNDNITTTTEILNEYNIFLRHLDYKLLYLKRYSTKKHGDKEIKLKNILDSNNNLYYTLHSRNNKYPGIDILTNFIINNSMNISRDGLFIKKKKGVYHKDVSKGDAELISYAIIDSFVNTRDTYILTSDLDLINILRNLSLRINQRQLPKGLVYLYPKAITSIYFPGENDWTDKFGLRFMCNSREEYGDSVFSKPKKIIPYSVNNRIN